MPWLFCFMDKLLKLIGIGAIIYFVSNKLGRELSNRISVGKITIQIRKAFPEFNLRLFIPVINNTPLSLPFDRFAGKLYYGNVPLADMDVSDPTTLEAGETITTELDVKVGYDNVTEQIANILQGGQILNRFYVKGYVYSSGVIIPIDQNIQII